MSDGKKAWAEEEEEKAYAARIDTLRALDVHSLAREISIARTALKGFEGTDPSLTKSQATYISAAVVALNKLP